MGQYSQWLHQREVDQQLRERLELLEQELHALQEQAARLKEAASSAENPILQAIAMQQSAEALLEVTPPSPSTQQLPSVHRESKEQVSKSVSSALFASLPRPEVNLLPPDMTTFIDTHEQTLPQTRLPKWLRHTTPDTYTTAEPKLAPSALDERTDASIRRWLQRWGKQLPDSPPTLAPTPAPTPAPQQQMPQEVHKHE
jgi:hypothetical protein